MASALIVSQGDKGPSVLREMLTAAGYDNICVAGGCGDARRQTAARDFELVIINAPLPDEYGQEFAAYAASRGLSVILLCKPEHADELSQVLEREGVFVMSKPLVRPLIMQALRIITLTHERLYKLTQERDKLSRQLEDLRAVSRAKCLLIEKLGWSESQAHRHIEKQAMDLRISKRDAAESIIRTYIG